MDNFCTCTELDCEYNPHNHDKGCSPCIEANLKTREIPNCMLYEMDPENLRDNDSFDFFADLLKED